MLQPESALGRRESKPPVAQSQGCCVLTAATVILLRSASPGAATRRGRGLHGWVRGKRTAGPSPSVLHSSRHPAKVAGVTRADSRLPPPFPSTRTLTLPFRSEFLESIILQNGRKHVFTHKYHLHVSV